MDTAPRALRLRRWQSFSLQPAKISTAQNADADIAQKLDLTAAQRNAIYATISKDRSKTSPQRFPVAIGAEVPPMINLYALPDDIVAGNSAAKLIQCTMVGDKVVLVDPTRMRVVDTIGPQPQQ